MKKKFLIHCNTTWCGMDQEYAALAEHESDLYDIADELAYENFCNYDCQEEVAEDNGYDPSEMTEDDWDTLWDIVDEGSYYGAYIEEFTGSEEEWNEYAKNGVYNSESYV